MKKPFTAMTPHRPAVLAPAAVALLLLFLPLACGSPAGSEEVTAETVEAWMQELSNWGRWGEDDELGALNLITPEKRRQAAALVEHGISVSLAHETIKEFAPDVTSPFLHEVPSTGANAEGSFSVDTYSVLYHGYAHSHMDALCHMWNESGAAPGRMYNGFGKETVTEAGCGKLGIGVVAREGVFTRGVLIDVPRLRGVPYLEPGDAIRTEDLDAWLEQTGTEVGAGDVVFIRTGRWARRAEMGPWDIGSNSAGLHVSAARWLKERDVAALGSDAASDLLPSGVEGVTHPVHLLVLVAMGMPIFDNADLEALAAEAARLERWDFLLTAAPIRVPGGTGSPLNAIATF